MALKIEYGVDNPILRTVSSEVTKNELKKYEKLAKEMLKYVKNPKHGGVGLAAPQVGVNKRIMVCSLLEDWDDEDFRTLIMINPEILEMSSETMKSKEGCLSLPKIPRGIVKRVKTVKLKYDDIKGKTNTIIVHEVAACVVQHEIDHLDGILYTDKLENAGI